MWWKFYSLVLFQWNIHRSYFSHLYAKNVSKPKSSIKFSLHNLFQMLLSALNRVNGISVDCKCCTCKTCSCDHWIDGDWQKYNKYIWSQRIQFHTKFSHSHFRTFLQLYCWWINQQNHIQLLLPLEKLFILRDSIAIKCFISCCTHDKTFHCNRNSINWILWTYE